MTAYLGSKDGMTAIFASKLSTSSSPNFDTPIMLLQGQDNVTCISVFFTSKDIAVADCYYVQRKILVNEW